MGWLPPLPVPPLGLDSGLIRGCPLGPAGGLAAVGVWEPDRPTPPGNEKGDAPKSAPPLVPGDAEGKPPLAPVLVPPEIGADTPPDGVRPPGSAPLPPPSSAGKGALSGR